MTLEEATKELERLRLILFFDSWISGAPYYRSICKNKLMPGIVEYKSLEVDFAYRMFLEGYNLGMSSEHDSI